MAGKIKSYIDQIMKLHTENNHILYKIISAKLILKGINPTKFDEKSADDPVIIEKLLNYAKEIGVNIKQ